MPLAMLPSYSLIVLLTLSACQLKALGQTEFKQIGRPAFWRTVRAPMYLGYGMDMPRVAGRPNTPPAVAASNQIVRVLPVETTTAQIRKVYHPLMRSRFFY
ncbi:hypothetical protein M3Y97_00180800 [Aphelenchoides bicaudatus]|nr:hypothetical protein M3Y97_00180800 [Aphelenchoides bicaudatus]